MVTPLWLKLVLDQLGPGLGSWVLEQLLGSSQVFPASPGAFPAIPCWGYNSQLPTPSSFLWKDPCLDFTSTFLICASSSGSWICISISLFLETLAALPRFPVSPSHILSLNSLQFRFSSSASSYKGAEINPLVMELPFGLAGLHLFLQVIQFVPGAGEPGGCGLVLAPRPCFRQQGHK